MASQKDFATNRVLFFLFINALFRIPLYGTNLNRRPFTADNKKRYLLGLVAAIGLLVDLFTVLYVGTNSGHLRILHIIYNRAIA